jgi:hypothetical protein
VRNFNLEGFIRIAGENSWTKSTKSNLLLVESKSILVIRDLIHKPQRSKNVACATGVRAADESEGFEPNALRDFETLKSFKSESGNPDFDNPSVGRTTQPDVHPRWVRFRSTVGP